MAKRITLRDFYLKFPYKTYDVNSNTVPVPYVPKEEISDHKDALTFKQWRIVIDAYFKYLMKYLLTGKGYVIPNRLGIFQLLKWLPKKKGVNFKKTKEVYGEVNKELPKGSKKIIYHMNHHSKGYRPFFMWDRRTRKFRFPFKWHWRFKLSRNNKRMVSKALLSDLTIINKLHQK